MGKSRFVLASGDTPGARSSKSGHSPFAEVILSRLHNPVTGYVSANELYLALNQSYLTKNWAMLPPPGRLPSHDRGEFVFVSAAEQVLVPPSPGG